MLELLMLLLDTFTLDELTLELDDLTDVDDESELESDLDSCTLCETLC